MNSSKPKPDFLIIGSMKCATSAIYEYLCYHPKVLDRKPKEIHFYTNNFQKGYNWYYSFFKEKTSGYLVGEASPSYFDRCYDYQIPQLILQDFPSIKIILSLRNPTQRAISHFYDLKNKGKLDENYTVEDYFSYTNINKFQNKQRKELPPYLTAILKIGQYSNRLPYWLDIYNLNNNIIIVNQSKLEQATATTMKEIYEFLNLEPISNEINYQKFYTKNYPKIPKIVYDNLDAFYQPYNLHLSKILGEEFFSSSNI